MWGVAVDKMVLLMPSKWSFHDSVSHLLRIKEHVLSASQLRKLTPTSGLSEREKA